MDEKSKTKKRNTASQSTVRARTKDKSTFEATLNAINDLIELDETEVKIDNVTDIRDRDLITNVRETRTGDEITIADVIRKGAREEIDVREVIKFAIMQRGSLSGRT